MEITSKFLTDLIAKLRSGVDVEDDKLDIKGQWYDLSDKKGQEEICKDIAAMANTTGPTGHIIIGINKDGSLVDSPFKESHLADKTHLQGIVVKRVDLPVRGHHYSPTRGQDNSPTPCGRKRFKIGGNAPRRKDYVAGILPISFLRWESPLS